MRDLKRNQQTLWYSLLSVSKDTDEWGNTVDIKGYAPPVSIKMSISSDKGEAFAQTFGTDLQYDREMSTHDTSCPIDEHSHLWLDGRDTGDTYNYVVVGVSKSLNCIRYAIRRVNVS